MNEADTLQDFILSDNGDLFPIECNPRIHTAICLLRLNPTFAHAYLSDSIEGIAKPPAGTKPCSWLGHDLPALFLAALLPATESVHPYWEGMQVNELKWDTHDPTFDPEDPLPFFGLYHVQWTWVSTTLRKRGFADATDRSCLSNCSGKGRSGCGSTQAQQECLNVHRSTSRARKHACSQNTRIESNDRY